MSINISMFGIFPSIISINIITFSIIAIARTTSTTIGTIKLW